MKIGSDKVDLQNERLIIHARETMAWPIREFCRVPISIQGQKYYLRSRRPAERPFAMIYELWPWPVNMHEASNKEIVYDEAYVLERDMTEVKNRRHELLYWVLVPLYPFLGLCWSRFKDRVLRPWGFELKSITAASIALIFWLFIAEGICVGWLVGGILTYGLGNAALRPLDWMLMFLLGTDSVMRFGQSLKFDVEDHWGFCEWVWPGRR